jgi:glutamate-5-semialdehyde dehydrogenase
MSAALMKKIAKRSKEAAYAISNLSLKERNAALETMAKQILRDQAVILRANSKDLKLAVKNGLASALMGRLQLNEMKIAGMARSLRDIKKLPEPLGRALETIRRPNGLRIRKISVPLGVILIVFESRPNVTADCAGLCLKSGNSVILRGGKEAYYSNQAIHRSITRALKKHGIPASAVEFISTRDRKDVHVLLTLVGLIDVVIPRGGESLIRTVANHSKIPVIKHYHGVCHTYIDKDADLAKALKIAQNAKVQNPGVCNAMETLLVDRPIAKRFLTPFSEMMKKSGVELRGCGRTRKILKGIRPATDKDWRTEYLDKILSVRVVDGVDQATEHIRNYGSNHSECIVSRNPKSIRRFTDGVDSACVFQNASTRFNDGGEFGMGAEMGISTDKLHARGPVGLRELTSYKYVIQGSGQIRT